MKKTRYLFLIGVAALAAMISCAESTGEFTANTNEITLSAAASGRALTGPIAEFSSDYYEAAFRRTSDGAILRAIWTWASTGKILLGAGTYNVILFAGKYQDKTLLGLGKVVRVLDKNGNDIPGAIGLELEVTTTSGTARIIFELNPLVNNVNSWITAPVPNANSVTDSTFQTDYGYDPFPPADGLQTRTVKDSLENDIPVFMINNDPDAASKLYWAFGINAYPDDNNLGAYNSSIMVKAAAKTYVNGFSGSVLWGETQVTVNPLSPVNGHIPDDGTLVFSAQVTGTADAAGIAEFAFELPVCAFNAADANAVTWFIRGGLANSLPDGGVTPSKEAAGMLGGSVLLGFGGIFP